MVVGIETGSGVKVEGISSFASKDNGWGTNMGCVGLAEGWRRDEPRRICIEVCTVALSVGVGFFKPNNVQTDLAADSLPHCWEGGCLLESSGRVVHHSRTVTNTGCGYNTFADSDLLILEQRPGQDVVCYRVRHGIRRRLATLPTSLLPGNDPIKPYIFLRGFSSKQARVCVRPSELPVWSVPIRFQYPTDYQRAAAQLVVALSEIMGGSPIAADLTREHILPFCGWYWFSDAIPYIEAESEEAGVEVEASDSDSDSDSDPDSESDED